MAVELNKEEILKSLPLGQTASGTVNTFNQILQFLNTPSVQLIVNRLLDRVLPSKSQANSDSPQVETIKKEPFDISQISVKDKITVINDFISRLPEDYSNKQIREEIDKTKKALGL